VIPPVTLSVSGSRFRATYLLTGSAEEARARADAIAVEQTIEFPADLIADDDIRRHVIGRIEDLRELEAGRHEAVLSYAVESSGWELPQLLNVLFGNCSLIPGVRLIAVALPDDLAARFQGPRFGMAGLRELLRAPDRPLIATALKPMGLDARALAAMAGVLAESGIDIIKDDHGLANQPFAPFRERVRACAEAVAEANARTGGSTIYLPSVSGPADEVVDRARFAKEVGATGLLVIPGLTGLDTMRRLADDDELALPVMAHPAFQGSYVVDDRLGIGHGVLFGTLARLAGADLTVFPGYGGRFSFSRDACTAIVDACAAPLGSLRPSVPAPGGGMTLDRLDELLAFYGRDCALLIGGNLHREDLRTGAGRMRRAVEALAGGGGIADG
jgi:ribulose-bisphosphate carboxylase large chain